MPMLKTAPSGTTNVTNVRTYLLKGQRQERQSHEDEWNSYKRGEIQLSEQQAGYLQNYLGEHSRGLAVDVSDDLSVRNWARQMDLTRAQYGHDRDVRGKRGRSYYHFILSPDPGDACSLSTMRDYAKAWAEANFRSGGKQHEYAIVYHDDNAKGVLHAHIVVNVTDKFLGRKLHLDNNEVAALAISAQEIGKRYGLTPIRDVMQSTVGARTMQPIYLDRAEREILNKGGYSWKWELRKVISDLAPISRDLEDFRFKLNHAGYDVSQSKKTGYLTYTHKNGLKVKDSRLGARFYLESLERIFNHEQLLDDRTYASWELIQISKGKMPWKEDIRQAIDSIAPTVMSIPELQRELSGRYGIRLIINRRGITYQHPCGFKVRDESIGFRYTFEGLRENAVVGMVVPYPGYESILRESSSMVKHYLPRSAQGMGGRVPEQIASLFVFRDMANLMVRSGLSRMEDVAKSLEDRHDSLMDEKGDLMELRNELMRWNHLVSLQTRFEKDRAFLRGPEGEAADPSLFNDTLIRYERIGGYLKEQAGGKDIRASQASLSATYERRLSDYLERLGELERDTRVYQNYLMGHNVQSIHVDGEDSSVDAQALFAASRTLASHHIRDYFHLDQSISSFETRLGLVSFKLKNAESRKRELDGIQADILAYSEMKAYQPTSKALAERPFALGIQAQEMRFSEASRRLESLGISEADFSAQHEELEKVKEECAQLRERYEHLQQTLGELKGAREVCLTVAETVKGSPLARVASDSGKGSSSDGEDLAVGAARPLDSELDASKSEPDKPTPVADIPFEEARRRHKERLLRAPERSRTVHRDIWR